MLQCIIIALAIFLLLKIISLPIRLIWKLGITPAGGFACLVAVPLLGPYTGVLFDLNLVTAAIVGFLGLPGIVLLFVLHFFLK